MVGVLNQMAGLSGLDFDLPSRLEAGQPPEARGLTRDQVRLSGDRRRGNLKGSFRVVDNELRDKRIIMVDDVMTTGATLHEVRKEIIKAGGKPVLAVVAAAAGL